MKAKEMSASPEIKSGDGFNFIPFSERIRQIRKATGETQEQFARRLGISKQILSLYEQGQRSPKVAQIEKFAGILELAPDYLLDDTAEAAAFREAAPERKGKPFYQVFNEVVHEQLGLTGSDAARATGLTERQVRDILQRRMEIPPLPLALQLSEKLNVPLYVWTGMDEHTPVKVSDEGYRVARAYENASPKEQFMVRYTFGLENI